MRPMPFAGSTVSTRVKSACLTGTCCNPDFRWLKRVFSMNWGKPRKLPPGAMNALLGAMETVQEVLAKNVSAPNYVLRRDRVGDLGHIASRQGLIYEQEYGWDKTYEALAAKILGEFAGRNDAVNERDWIAESHGAILGSVYLMKEDAETARLRLLYVEPQARGTGLGKKLVSECTAFARAAGYKRIVLWTQSTLTAARKLYVNEGYQLIKQEPHHSFGKDLVGETWQLALTK